MIKLGTCSWKFPSWQGLVYSAPKVINYLEEYARRFNTVEIDQWFWSLFGVDRVTLPRPEVVKAYRQAVPDDFRFTIKVPNAITLTHFYRKRKSDPLVPNPHFLSPSLFESFLSLLQPLEDVLGSLLFQFEYLNRQKVPNQKEFLERLKRFSGVIPVSDSYAVEIRNAQYLNGDYFDLLSRTNLNPVLLQGYWMPPITEVFQRWGKEIAAHKAVVIRLHGPDRKKIEEQTGKRWDRIVEPRDEELKAIVKMIADLAARETEVYVNVNNHYEGSAPLTIDKLQALLDA
ncbi:DUF72 domain-containing protein [Candidatus Zixiibacteriota bacterium]